MEKELSDRVFLSVSRHEDDKSYKGNLPVSIGGIVHAVLSVEPLEKQAGKIECIISSETLRSVACATARQKMTTLNSVYSDKRLNEVRCLFSANNALKDICTNANHKGITHMNLNVHETFFWRMGFFSGVPFGHTIVFEASNWEQMGKKMFMKATPLEFNTEKVARITKQIPEHLSYTSDYDFIINQTLKVIQKDQKINPLN